MNLLFPLVAVAALFGPGLRWRTQAAHHVRIGAYYYNIALNTERYPGDRPDETTFVVTGANAPGWQWQCAGTRLLVTHQGVVLSKGKYAVDGSRLLLMERLYNPRGIQGKSVPDSVLRTFTPDRTGKLRLIDAWEYRAGKGKKIILQDIH